MYGNPQKGHNAEEVTKLRQEAGRWLKERREARNMSQRDLADALGFSVYTFISQIENGRGRIPPHQYAMFAQALNIRRREFVTKLLAWYDPLTYDALFGVEEPFEEIPVEQLIKATRDNKVAQLSERIAKLEALLLSKENGAESA